MFLRELFSQITEYVFNNIHQLLIAFESFSPLRDRPVYPKLSGTISSSILLFMAAPRLASYQVLFTLSQAPFKFISSSPFSYELSLPRTLSVLCLDPRDVILKTKTNK